MRFNIWGTQEQAVAGLAKQPGAVVTRHKTLPIVSVIHPIRGTSRACFALWMGKAGRPSAYYSFRDMTVAQNNLAAYWKRAEEAMGQRDTRKRERSEQRANLRAADHYVVGDVIYNSWGYDQTNIDYFQVVEVKAKSIVIREIAQNRSQTGYMSGEAQPIRNKFCGEPITKVIGLRGGISFDHGAGAKWDGKAKYYSSYA